MMKKLVLIIVGFCGLGGMVSAQTVTNTRQLNELTARLKLAGSINYAKALTLAKQKGWPLSYGTKNGGIAVLAGVDFFGFPKYHVTFNNTIAAATTGANKLWPGGSSGLNLTGGSDNMKNKLGIWDGGSVLGTHVEMAGRVTQRDNPSGTVDHSTHVAGTMMAKGVNPASKGMAYGLQGLIAYDFNNDNAEVAAEAANLLVSNHSYGFNAGWVRNTAQNNRWEFYGEVGANEDYKFGFYSDESAAFDEIAYNAPFYLIVKAAGNPRDENGPAEGSPYFRFNAQGQMVASGNRPPGISSNNGYDIIVEDIGAKNILTVGAVNGIPSGYGRKEDVTLTSFSAWGPTDDGRIKPDIVADGVNVLSASNASNTSYAFSSGTSMASPNAAGSVFLLQEHYSKLKGATSFLRSATLKGLAIHTADEAGANPGPDYQFGWGLLNVKKAADVITAAVPSNNAATSTHLLYENTLAQGASFTTTVIASGKGQLQATICWTDVKGTVETANRLNNRTKKLVNDLDIRITKGSGATLKTYRPWTLDVNNPSVAAIPGDNIVDNVERIDIDSTVPGQTYTITVTHKGTLVKGPQAYSLLVSGVGGTAYCASTSGGGGARIDSVNFKTIHILNSPGSKTYTDNTNFIADIEAAQTNPISIRVSTADATSNPRIVKVFIDYNNNGAFETSELVATSNALPSTSSVFNANFTTPATLTVGSIYLMRIVVQETSVAADVAACGTYAKGETQDYRVRVVDPSNDVSVREIFLPSSIECSSTAQYVTVDIRNNGSVSQSNIPLTVVVATGGTNVANLAFTYPGPIPPLTNTTYTFQVPFVTSGGTAYTITATANASTDQNPSNNSVVSTLNTLAKPTISAAGEICAGTTALLKVNSPQTGANYFWYTSPLSSQPFATGSAVNTTTIPTNKTYYVAKEIKTSIGPANKAVFASGGYNNFFDNYVKITTSVPLVLENVRLYIGWPGKIRIRLGNNFTGTNYSIVDQVVLDVYPTTPTPAKGTTLTNSATDTGAIYTLNLYAPAAGDYILLVQCLDAAGDGTDTNDNRSTIFRNNNITGTTYPISIPNVISITGNGATGMESQFYYFFYDLKIRTEDCASDRISVVATDAPVPQVSQVADSLVSTVATGNQWYKDNVLVVGATGKSYKPTATGGSYKVIVTDAFGCVQTSNAVTYSVTAIPVFDPQEIKLMVSPNPNNGVFNLSFEVTGKADLSIDIVSSSGQRVFNNTIKDFAGKYSKQLDLSNASSEFYILKIQHNKKNYVQKVLIQR